MIYRTLITLTFLLFSLTNVVGQNRLILEKKNNPSNKRYLNLDRDYVIKTMDTTYYYKKIIGFNDTTISIPILTKTGRDTTYTYSRKINKTKDTTYFYTEPIFKHDTIIISIADIKELKFDWFENRGWLQPFGMIAIGAAAGIIFLPAVAIKQGAEGVKEWAHFEAVLVAVSAIPIFIGTRKSKYDLANKWTMKMEK